MRGNVRPVAMWVVVLAVGGALFMPALASGQSPEPAAAEPAAVEPAAAQPAAVEPAAAQPAAIEPAAAVPAAAEPAATGGPVAEPLPPDSPRLAPGNDATSPGLAPTESVSREFEGASPCEQVVATRVAACRHRADPTRCEERARAGLWRCTAPRHLALGIGLLKEIGFGGLVRGRYQHVSLEIAGAYVPILIFGNDITYLTSGQFSAATVLFFNKDWRPVQGGLRLGYAYNNVLKNGATVGVDVEFSRFRNFALSVGFGTHIFPQTKDEIFRQTGTKVESSAMVQIYIGLSLLFYVI